MEELKHECGVALVRLLKPLDYYQKKYGTWRFGLNRLYLMMEKQHNRGQEGAGLACVKMNAAQGEEFMFRERGLGAGAITEIFSTVQEKISHYSQEEQQDSKFAERYIPFAGELYMGHLRYSTTGRSGLSYVHPFMRRNNWRARNLCLCGNFNMTNVDEIFDYLTSLGQHPRFYSDTYFLLEHVGHRLDRESDRLFEETRRLGLVGREASDYIEQHIDLANVLKTCATHWDGGYVVCGATGSGEMFAMRDPGGIRPAFWYKDDEVFVLASERPVIQTAFHLEVDQIHELQPGQAVLVNQACQFRLEQIITPQPNQVRPCSFERIYFSRGSDQDIYMERKALGSQLADEVLQAVDNDLDHTVFSFIPNTAEVAFYGLTEGVEHKAGKPVRREKVAWKDIKLRTFISESSSRNDLAAHVYDITYGSLRQYEDNLVIIDDSIVRGTTLKESIIRILDRLHPKKMVIVSSSPQIRYPDYYGIDMAHLSEFIAFRAAIALIEERGMWQLLTDVYNECRHQLTLPKEQMQNVVKSIYTPFTEEEINQKMVALLRPEEVTTPIQLVFQSIEGLHKACPTHTGDWYFTGDYPTTGGTRDVLKAYIDYYEQNHH